MARIKGISREIDALVKAHLSPQRRRQVIAEVARQVIAEADAQNTQVTGSRIPYDTFVDGRSDAPFTSVNIPNGVIVAKWQMVTEAVDYAWRLLVENSPFKTGRYRESHTLFADGEQVTEPNPNRFAKQWVLMSSVPYARKIEGGPNRPPQSDQAPEGVYEVTAAMVRRRYGNVADVRFTFLDWAGGSSMFTDWLNGREYQLLGAAAGRRQRLKDARQPTIVISHK